MAGTDIFWREFDKSAGITLGLLLPLLLGVGAVMPAVFRPSHRHEEAMQEARLRADQVRRCQLRELEDQIWRESLPDWRREAIEAADRKRAEIKREARRRLGLPEEEA
jgi:hypothetical protein